MNDDDIESRAARREEELLAALSTQRRLARPTDYVYDKAQEAFWDLRDGTKHSKEAVNASIPQELWRVVVTEEEDGPRGRGRPRARERLVPPSQDIMRVETDQFVEATTWWPGRPEIIRDWFINGEGVFPAPGRRIYNRYRPAPELGGDPREAEPWLAHVRTLWPDKLEHEYFFDWCAHMVQRPGEKCNTALVFAGKQGIGKDLTLAAVKLAVGEWNSCGIDPDHLFGQYKPFLQTVLLVVDEARPHADEMRASSMYNIMKPLIATPPNTLPINEKYQNLKHIPNVLRLIITTNHPLDLYIPDDDRRMFIMTSPAASAWAPPEYFAELARWTHYGGAAHVQAWLAARDLSAFNCKAPPPRTQGWAAVAQTWSAPDDAVTQALEALGRPDVLLGSELLEGQFDGTDELVAMMKSPRKIAHRMQREGYAAVLCPTADRWSFTGAARVVRSRFAFVRADLPSAAQALIEARGRRLAAAPAPTLRRVV